MVTLDTNWVCTMWRVGTVGAMGGKGWAEREFDWWWAYS